MTAEIIVNSVRMAIPRINEENDLKINSGTFSGILIINPLRVIATNIRVEIIATRMAVNSPMGPSHWPGIENDCPNGPISPRSYGVKIKKEIIEIRPDMKPSTSKFFASV